jgi:PTH2 family peptidyl-tRNA hydrolase
LENVPLPTKPKQVIVVNKALGMEPGKLASQVAHASMKIFFDRSAIEMTENDTHKMTTGLSKDMRDWVMGEFTKIVLEAKNEKQMLDIYEKALAAGLPCCLIQDNGHTVFNGVKTYTTVGIGPANPNEINAITGKLRLLK